MKPDYPPLTELLLEDRQRKVVGAYLADPFGGLRKAVKREQAGCGSTRATSFTPDMKAYVVELLAPLARHFTERAVSGGAASVVADVEANLAAPAGAPAPAADGSRALAPVGGAGPAAADVEPSRAEVFREARRSREALERLRDDPGAPHAVVLAAIAGLVKINEQMAKGAGANRPIEEEAEAAPCVLVVDRDESIEAFAKRRGITILPEGGVVNDMGPHSG